MGIIDSLFRKQIDQAIRKQFAILESEANFMVGVRSLNESARDRLAPDRSDILEQSLDAWRTNPLARRIVELTSQYCCGGGLAITSKDRKAGQFINEFWNHRLNNMSVRVYEMCDELTRSGNLFILFSSDPSGMSFVRVVPTSNVDDINARANDIEQPVSFKMKQDIKSFDAQVFPAYDEKEDDLEKAVMVQYTINKPSGAQWGESDLAPILKWLSRYSSWLEDRARLNRYRNAFLYTVSAKFASEVQRKARQQALNAEPPQPGSILVTDENEVWNVINPKLESREAAADGLALKKMIAAGSGIPMHFLAEPESSTRTTAAEAGGPTYRRFQERQDFFLWVLTDILTIATHRRALADTSIRPKKSFNPYEISIQGTDINTNDNISLAMAAGNILAVLTTARDRQLIDDSEFLRLLYKFTGENIDIEEMLKRGQAAPNILPPEDSQKNDGASQDDSGGVPAAVSDPHQYPPAAKGDKSKGIKK